jgi:RNA polymerase sigma factor (sigma-70 family)
MDLQTGPIATTPLSFDDAFADTYPMVARTAGLVARDRQLGADIAQEAFIRLFERWDRIQSADHARNFALRVAVNLARSHLRRRAAAPFGLRGPEIRVSDTTAASDAWITVAQALGALSPAQRACVVLVDYADLDSDDAGTILGIAPSTVRVHLARGRQKLRTALSLPQEGER